MSPDLSHTLGSGLKHSSLFFPGDLRVKRQDSVSMATFEGHNIGGITMSYIKRSGDTSHNIWRKHFA